MQRPARVFSLFSGPKARPARPVSRGSILASLSTASLLTSLGCAGPPPIHETQPERLRIEIARDVPQLARNQVVVPHELSPQTKARLDLHLSELGNRAESGRALVSLLFGENHLGLEYAWAETHTAEETLRIGRGNCLSLAAVVVGVARAYGGAARYVEIQGRPEQRDEGDLHVWAGHIAVFLPSPAAPLIIDFTGTSLTNPASFRLLGDRDLVARYYNDLGYDLIRLARKNQNPVPWNDAREFFEIATAVDPKFGQAWNNLGVALARLEQFEAAETAYRRARIQKHRFLDAATSENQMSLTARRELSGKTQPSGTRSDPLEPLHQNSEAP